MKNNVKEYAIPVLFASVIITLILCALYSESEQVIIAVIPAVCGCFYYYKYYSNRFLNNEKKITDTKNAFIHIVTAIVLLTLVYVFLEFAKDFVVCGVLISFVIFYQFEIKYSMSIIFLTAIIPCAVYSANNYNMNSIYLCSLITLMFLFLLKCKKNHMSKNNIIIYGYSYNISIILMAAVVCAITLYVPKPEVTPFSISHMRSRMGDTTATDYSGHSSNISSKGATQNENLDKLLFLVKADETIYLRRQVMGNYIPEVNAFGKLKGEHFHTGYSDWESKAGAVNMNVLFNMITLAAQTNEEFAMQYGNIIQEIPTITESIKSAQITYANLSTDYIPLTLKTYNISGRIVNSLNHYRLPEGIVFLNWEKNEKITPGNSYSIEYYDEIIRNSKPLQDFSALFTLESYVDFIYDIAITFNNARIQEYDAALDELNYQLSGLFEFQREVDYTIPEEIKLLADEITLGKNSYYEKAKAIADYFYNNSFVYDLTYSPANNESIENFIFASKRGTCSSYAAAMTLMAWAVDLPARYVEGFKTGSKNDDGLYEITPLNSHAFPEVFIPGYGWTTFEPTPPIRAGSLRHFINENALWLLLFTVISILSAYISILIYRTASEKCGNWLFIKRFQLSDGKGAAILYLSKLQTLVNSKYKIEVRPLTPRLFADFINRQYKYEMRDVFLIIESVIYGGYNLTEENRRYLIENYNIFYKCLKHKIMSTE